MGRRKLVIEDMEKSMPPYARQDGIGLHELILLPLNIDLNDVNINWHKTEIDFADLD